MIAELGLFDLRCLDSTSDVEDAAHHLLRRQLADEVRALGQHRGGKAVGESGDREENQGNDSGTLQWRG
jgi:hypothetical protein